MKTFNQAIILLLLFCFSIAVWGEFIEDSNTVLQTLDQLVDDEGILYINQQEQNLLHLAVWTKDLAIVQYIYNKEPSLLKGKDEDGDSPFLYSCIIGNEEISNFFLEKGADIDETNNSLYTCLHYSVNNMHLSHVQAMCAKGADPTKQDENGDTPAHKLLENLEDIGRFLYDTIVEPDKIEQTMNALSI